MTKITYDNKIGITPKDVHINQVWDDDMNEIKTVVNEIDDRLIAVENGNVNVVDVSAVWVSGFTFDVTANNYPILNDYYYAPPTTKILSSADATLDRIDLICAKIPSIIGGNGTIVVIEGTLATTSLVVPPDYDAAQYYVIKEIIIRAAATVPTDINGTIFTKEFVYINGTGEPDEWTFSSNSGNIINSGGYINGTNVVQGNTATMTNDAAVSDLNYLKGFNLSFDITLKAIFGTSYIYIRLLDVNGISITNNLLINNGDYGFNASLLTVQRLVINGNDFNFISNSDVYAVQIFPYKTFAGYLIDNINFGIGSGLTTQTIQDGSITVSKLAPDVLALFQDKIKTLATNVIDWANPYGTLLRTFTGTPAVVWTEINPPITGTKKTITIYRTGAIASEEFPLSYKIADGSAVYDDTKINMLVLEYVNGDVFVSNVLYTI